MPIIKIKKEEMPIIFNSLVTHIYLKYYMKMSIQKSHFSLLSFYETIEFQVFPWIVNMLSNTIFQSTSSLFLSKLFEYL